MHHHEIDNAVVFIISVCVNAVPAEFPFMFPKSMHVFSRHTLNPHAYAPTHTSTHLRHRHLLCVCFYLLQHPIHPHFALLL